MREKISLLTRGAAIAALYVVLTLIFQPISFGQCQVRVSEALTLTPALWPEAIPGLFVGCFIANTLGGNGPWDIFLGSAATLFAAFLTRKAKNDFLAAASPVVVNALVVGCYMSRLTETPVLMWMLSVGFGETIACFMLGVPLLRFLRRTRFS
jgi:uncharacterized membrane protein